MLIDFQDGVTDEWLLAKKQQDPNGHWSLDHGFVEIVVLSTKKGCEALQSKFASASIPTTLRPPLQREQSGADREAVASPVLAFTLL